MNPAANANELGPALGTIADALLLLTATPIHLGTQDLFQLLHILERNEYDQFDTLDGRLPANRHLLETIAA